MPKLGDQPFIHPDCAISKARFGRYVEIGQGTRIRNSDLDDYSYCDRYCDISNARIGKFANIASFTRIGPTDHPMERASLHHFQYRSDYYWPDEAPDTAFFAHRESRVATIGHDTWIGHGAIVMPDVTLGHGAVVAAGAVVTHDVAPYTIVTGVPARPLRPRFAPHVVAGLLALAWWDWDHDTLRARLGDFRSLSAGDFVARYAG